MYDDLIKSFKSTIDEIGSKLEKGEEPFQEEKKDASGGDSQANN